MISEEAFRTLQEIIILYLSAAFAVGIVPSYVDSVPLIIVHLDVVPHMPCVCLNIKISENAHTWDIKSVTDKLERF